MSQLQYTRRKIVAIKFNFDRLKNIYVSTLKSYDKAVAFDVQIGKGKFLFMMYLSDEDAEAKDMLFIYMRNTNVLRKLKMYGNHTKGTFDVYISEEMQEALINELCLSHTGNTFDFNRFLNQLNSNIPLEITQATKINNLRNNRNIIGTLGVIDEAEKTVLIGQRYLSVGHPLDKTLRKLYLYTNADPKDIDELIKLLKKFNRTVAWTSEANKENAVDIHKLISSLS